MTNQDGGTPGAVRDMLAEGRLADALASVTQRLRTAPGDAAARLLMAELLCLSGALDRADTQLDVLAQQTTDRPVAISRLRHLLRAAQARNAWFNDAAAPTLLEDAGAAQQAAIRLALAQRENDAAEAARLLEKLEEARPKRAGVVDGVPFDDFRDVDDRCAGFLDVLTNDGNYVWVDLQSLESLAFQPVVRPIDLLWREARMTLRDGRVADVAVPAQYVSASPTEAQRLARETGWADGIGGTVSGTGQRVWLLGEEARPVLELTEVRFNAP